MAREVEADVSFDLRTISLGAGVQSTTLYLLAVEGAVGPMPDCAIFADTQSEPQWVYEHLDWLEREFGHVIPIHKVTDGCLEQDVLNSRDGVTRWASLPLKVAGNRADGHPSMLRRHCTREYKIDPIKRKVRELLGLKPRQHAAGRFQVEEWVGISADEAQRAKPSRYSWVTTRWPLLWDVPMRRAECIQWLDQRGYPVPQKSACYFCPFHDDRTWADFKRNHPAEFARAVQFDREIRKGKLRGVTEDAYLHRSLKPLDEVDFGDDTSNQLEIDFGNECEGMCGV